MAHDAPQFGVPRGFHQDPAKVAVVKNRLLDAGVKSCLATFVDIYCCVENRAVDLSNNPYLSAAISLAAGLDGIERELDGRAAQR